MKYIDPDLSEAFEVWCYRTKSAKRRLVEGLDGHGDGAASSWVWFWNTNLCSFSFLNIIMDKFSFIIVRLKLWCKMEVLIPFMTQAEWIEVLNPSLFVYLIVLDKLSGESSIQ